MSDFSHIARPYAQAVFDLADEQGDLASWANQLQALAMVVSDSQVARLIAAPSVSDAQIIDLVSGVCSEQLDEQGQNLLKLLVRNGRLLAVGELSEQYQALRDEAEQVIEAQLITATKVAAAQKNAISKALSKRLGKTVKLETEVDESLIGGAVVRAGDWVVDGSVKAQLGELVGALSR